MPENAISGFKAAGVVPLNSAAIPAYAFSGGGNPNDTQMNNPSNDPGPSNMVVTNLKPKIH